MINKGEVFKLKPQDFQHKKGKVDKQFRILNTSKMQLDSKLKGVHSNGILFYYSKRQNIVSYGFGGGRLGCVREPRKCHVLNMGIQHAKHVL